MWDRSKSVWTWEAVPGGAIPRLQEVVGSSRKDGLHPGLAFSLESYHPPHGSPPASSTLACVSSPTKCTISSLACSPSSFGPNPVYTVLDPTSIQMLLDNTAFLWVPWSSLDKDHPSPPEALALLSLEDLDTVTPYLFLFPLFLSSASAHMTHLYHLCCFSPCFSPRPFSCPVVVTTTPSP